MAPTAQRWPWHAVPYMTRWLWDLPTEGAQNAASDFLRTWAWALNRLQFEAYLAINVHSQRQVYSVCCFYHRTANPIIIVDKKCLFSRVAA